MRTSRIVIAAPIAMCVLLQACKRSGAALTTADLPGLYVCNIPGPVQTVELRRDGTFVQVVVGNDSESRTYSGHWSVETAEVESQVMLLPYHFEWPSYLGRPSTGAWFAEAKHTRAGGMLLVVSEDDGLYCVRDNQRRG